MHVKLQSKRLCFAKQASLLTFVVRYRCRDIYQTNRSFSNNFLEQKKGLAEIGWFCRSYLRMSNLCRLYGVFTYSFKRKNTIIIKTNWVIKGFILGKLDCLFDRKIFSAKSNTFYARPTRQNYLTVWLVHWYYMHQNTPAYSSKQLR